MRLALYLPEQVNKDLRHRAIDEGTSATKLVQRLIEQYIYETKPKEKKGGDQR